MCRWCSLRVCRKGYILNTTSVSRFLMAQVACLEATYKLQKQIAGASAFLQMSPGSGGQRLLLVPKGSRIKHRSERRFELKAFESRQRPGLPSLSKSRASKRNPVTTHFSRSLDQRRLTLVPVPEKTAPGPELSGEALSQATRCPSCPKDLSCSLWSSPNSFLFLSSISFLQRTYTNAISLSSLSV